MRKRTDSDKRTRRDDRATNNGDMASTGFTQSSGPARPFPIWVVFFLDKYAERPGRQVAGAFTSEVEATKLLRELRQLEGSRYFEYSVEPARLYKRNEDWRPDMANPPYETVPGLFQAKAILPEFKGHRCQTVSRILQQRPGQDPETRGLQIGWRTGAQVQLGVERPGTMLITQKSWSPPSGSPVDSNSADLPPGAAGWSSEPVSADDPLASLLGNTVHGFSVTENEDGSIGAIRLRFKTAALVVSAQGDRFHVEVVRRARGT